MRVQCSAEGGEGLLDQGTLLLAKKSPPEDYLSPPSATTVVQCVYIGPTAPKGLETNWIETLPGTEIFIGLLTYGPEDTVLDGTYKIPRFELVE